MDINLTLVFASTVVVAVICIISTVLTHKRIAELESKSVEKADLATTELDKALSKLLETVIKKIESFEESSAQIGTEHQLQVEKSFEDNLQTLKNLQKEVNGSFDRQHNNFTEGNIKLLSSLDESFSKVNESSKKGFESLSISTKEAVELITTDLKRTEVTLNNSIIDLGKEQHKVAFVNNQNQLSNFETLTTLLQSIRIDNIIELTNELGKHKKLTVETEDFVKKLGDCKVLTIEDKLTGQITQVYYENGIKRSTDTFSGEHLKYQMFFNEDGKASRGVELDTEGNLTFEYLYNEAGEVNKRIEHVYDNSGSVQKIEKSY
ncbi:hypothetical protein PAT01_35190 [Pseudoalteromonas atlantica]|uniref:Toxin-antitoxin system YwqK family antitoxin n=1 Tax=Pseudoalteromonas atlantica TaxID=288 RepID=A0ABQ0UIC1_PSEAF|nr:hypothetical protein PAT01_35190 [Pseudoalteromonas atlantica]